ncbi:MAG: hypothetical protein ACI9GW_003766, partial [Halieaceae bacterium]
MEIRNMRSWLPILLTLLLLPGCSWFDFLSDDDDDTKP